MGTIYNVARRKQDVIIEHSINSCLAKPYSVYRLPKDRHADATRDTQNNTQRGS